MEIRLQPLARRKAAALGEAGEAWVAALPRTLEELARRWDLTWERPLPGGSASYVRAARTADGAPRVVKVAMPDPTQDVAGEATLLAAAEGRGYALLHAHAPDHDALLLESLGRSLEQSTWPPERVLDALVDTLREAWQVPTTAPVAPKARDLADLVRRLDDRHRACDPDVRRQSEAWAEELAGPGPDAPVLCHGDPHPANALASTRTGGHLLVDPDGVRGDPAYDLGVTLREWNARLEEGGRPLLEGWCDRVAERSGVDRRRIWGWAFLERVSTGLYVLDFGAERIGQAFLASARLLLDGPNPRPTHAS